MPLHSPGCYGIAQAETLANTGGTLLSVDPQQRQGSLDLQKRKGSLGVWP